jgi:nicotinamide phosphoribosyltransferase
LSAAYYAQFHLNNGKPVGFSIPATEHSIMTAHPNEKEAMSVLLEKFGSGVCACVMDSYDYKEALEKVLPSVAGLKLKKGGFLVLRPDSGDPVEVVLMALRQILSCISLPTSHSYAFVLGRAKQRLVAMSTRKDSRCCVASE